MVPFNPVGHTTWLPYGNLSCPAATAGCVGSALRNHGSKCDHRDHQIIISENAHWSQENLSKLSARFVVGLVFRLKCDISFEASFGFLSDLVLHPRLFPGVLVPRREELTAVTPAV